MGTSRRLEEARCHPHFNTELGNSNQTEKERGKTDTVSATALVNGCEVTGDFTAEQAELTVRNPTGKATEVSFHYQVVYQNSRDRGDIFLLKGGSFEETVPPGREVIKREDILLDPNASRPVNYLKDLLVIRVSKDRLKDFIDIPIAPNKRLDVANQPVNIASQPTPGYSDRKAGPFGKLWPDSSMRIGPAKGKAGSDKGKTSGKDDESESPARDEDSAALAPLKPSAGRFVKTDRGYMIPYRTTIPGTSDLNPRCQNREANQADCGAR